MKWKDSDGGDVANAEPNDPYYEDDEYAAFKEKGADKPRRVAGNPVRYRYWVVGIAAVAAVIVLLLIFSNVNESADMSRIRALEERVESLSQRMEKYAGMDEKVTRIWEQAKAFENFKTRFERSEASMSLRMDHLAMSLDALQKKTDGTLKQVAALQRAASAAAPPAQPSPQRSTAAARTHTVAAGDTLFSISRRYNISMDTLKSINQLTDSSVIHVGQVLKVGSPAD